MVSAHPLQPMTNRPFGRYRSDGEYSGEAFRDDILAPALRRHDHVTLDLGSETFKVREYRFLGSAWGLIGYGKCAFLNHFCGFGCAPHRDDGRNCRRCNVSPQIITPRIAVEGNALAHMDVGNSTWSPCAYRNPFSPHSGQAASRLGSFMVTFRHAGCILIKSRETEDFVIPVM